jgi:CMP-N-acetylneuraminic acid synthetase
MTSRADKRDELLAIIPVKGFSERLSAKNMRMLAGRPLFAYTVDAALESGLFTEVCVSTEDEQIAEIARRLGAPVPFIRPPELSTSSVRLVTVCMHALDFYEAQDRRFADMALLLATSPLRTGQDIRDCYSHFKKTNAKTLMTYGEFDHSPYWALTEKDGRLFPIFEKAVHQGRHELPTPYRHNGAVLFMKTAAFRQTGEYYMDDIAGWYLPLPNGLDIDTEHDLQTAERVIAERNGAAQAR